LEKVSQAKFYIVGRGLSQKVAELQKPGVVIVGKTELPEKVYHQYSVMVVPLLSGSGMRIKLIEGMAYAKAIVSTSIGAEGITVSNEKNCLLANKADDFSNAVVELLTNTNKKEALQKEARTFVEQNFENTELVKKLIDFYKTL